jgi:hypothetical protein
MAVFGKVFQQRGGSQSGHLVRQDRAGLGDPGAKQLAADERHRVRPQHAGRGGDRRDRLELQVRSGQAGMLFGQVVRDRPRDPHQRERAVVHICCVGPVGRVEEHIAAGKTHLFPGRGQRARSGQGDQREEIIGRANPGMVIKALVADDSSLQQSRGRRPRARVNPSRVKAAEPCLVLDVEPVDQVGDYVHVPGGHLCTLDRYPSAACCPAFHAAPPNHRCQRHDQELGPYQRTKPYLPSEAVIDLRLQGQCRRPAIGT